MFLQAWAVTLLLEITCLGLLEQNRSAKEVILSGFLTSSLTLPYLWFILPRFIDSYNLFLLIGETSVTLAEAVLYFFLLHTSFKRALLLSVVCNLCSFLFGLVMQNLLH
jgi:hypothetical protein